MEMTARQRNAILGGATCVCGLAIVLTALLVVGVLLAIPLTAFCKVLWDGLRRELPRDVI